MNIGRLPASQSNSSPQSCPRSFLDLLPQEFFLGTDAMRIANPIMTGEEGVLGSAFSLANAIAHSLQGNNSDHTLTV